jgi:geranylgeranyl diphosphate synthase type II
MDFNDSLKAALNQALNRAGSISIAPRLEEAVLYSSFTPGKRIRPRLFMACAHMLGLSPEAVLPAALAIELLHCFTLIHDDLPCMDNDDFRRGLPSTHKKFDEATALLAGDALIFTALDLFLESKVELPQLHRGLKTLIACLGPRGVIGGQAAELQLNSRSVLTDLERVHLHKTGALFTAALQIPKLFAGIRIGSPEDLAITGFAHALGLSFQAADDLEDAQSSSHINPQHILFYLSPAEVECRIKETLACAHQNLTAIWGTQASELQSFTIEILQKTEATRT